MLNFHHLTVADREAYQTVSLKAGRRNCNFTFANLIGWQFWFHTEVCIPSGLAPAPSHVGEGSRECVVLRFTLDGRRAYMLCMANDWPQGHPDAMHDLFNELMDDAGGELTIVGLEDDCVEKLTILNPQFSIQAEPLGNQYDYIYRKDALAALAGGKLKAKRNHVNKFHVEHPDFEYRELTPAMFDDCRRLVALWQSEKAAIDSGTADPDGHSQFTVLAEQRAMETVFAHWEALGMLGGSIWLEGRMVAFTYGAAVTDDTIDVCVEKADRTIDGLFAAINQQFCAHLPEQYIYVNREEDMGLDGLRKAKLSYHPEILLSYNVAVVSRSVAK